MGLCIPRPAMRCGEERRVKDTLAKHAALMSMLKNEGMDANRASELAFNIVVTSGRRKKIWKGK